jgi:hypothetical protein
MVKAIAVPWIIPNQARFVSAGITRHHIGTNFCPKGKTPLNLASNGSLYRLLFAAVQAAMKIPFRLSTFNIELLRKFWLLLTQ